MLARAFWKAVTMDRSDLLDRILGFLAAHDVDFCLIGGQNPRLEDWQPAIVRWRHQRRRRSAAAG